MERTSCLYSPLAIWGSVWFHLTGGRRNHGSNRMKDKTKCKVCGEITLCDLCDDHERRVCIFCMTPEHRKLWDERVKVLTSVTMKDVKP